MPRTRLLTVAIYCISFGPLLSSVPLIAQMTTQNHPPAAEISSDLRWRMIGPYRGGRTRAAAGVPDQPNLFYIGQVDGGVWRSNDSGRTWNPIFDAQPTQSIGAIAVAPSNSSVIYVSSGEGLHRPDLSIGNGIYKSTDAGASWTHLGLRDGQQIPALSIDPHDPNRLFAAVLGHPYGPNEERGIFRSLDGGATWEKVLYKDQNTGGADVVIDPQNPRIVYATLWQSRIGPWEDGNQYQDTHGGIFKSTDAGSTWHQLTNGLPAELVQANLAIAASDSHRLYATLSTKDEGGYGSGVGLGVYRSDDAGENWRKITEDPRPAMKIGGGDLPVPKVDPQNPDVVYSTSIVTCRSTDGGKTWVSLRGAPGGDDYQNIWINPKNPNIILLVSDQGAVVSENGGKTWGTWYNQPTAQLYHVAVTHEFPYKVCAGQQESGSVCIASRGNDGEITFRDWHPVGIIEYGYAAPDPLHPEIVYGAGRTEVSRFNTITGQVQNVTPIPVKDAAFRADRTQPILFAPTNPHLLYYVANVVFATQDDGQSWKQISPDLTREHAGKPSSLPDLPAKDESKRLGAIYSFAASYQNSDTLWAGTDDGLIWNTRDGGKNWNNITPPELTPWSKVSQLSASHFDDSTAYASVSRFRIDDLRPYLYRTHDSGKTWQSISSGLPPDAPVNTIREDPVRKGLLFAGTETGVWMSSDDGNHWQSLQQNLPHTSMRDLWIEDSDLIVATHGRSFWIMDDISPLRQIDDAAASTKPFLFKPAAAYRVRRSTYTDTPLPADEPTGENPPNGAVIDYSLPPSISGVVTLEILDADGHIVRSYASSDKPETTEAELSKQLIPLYWIRKSRTLPATSGKHRWVWDIRYATPVSLHRAYPISAVPHDTPSVPLGELALPGTYTVRLTAQGQTSSAPLTIKMDPRVTTTAADLKTLFAQEHSLAAGLDEVSTATLTAHALREQIAKLPQNLSPALAASIKKTDATLEALLDAKESDGEKSDPGLDDLSAEIAGLYAQVGQADALPTKAQQQASQHANEELQVVLRHWDEFKKTTLPELNGRLRSARLPQLQQDAKPANIPDSGDED